MRISAKSRFHTLLALSKDYALIGCRDGMIKRVNTGFLRLLLSGLPQAIKIPLPKKRKEFKFIGLTFTENENIPPNKILAFQVYYDEMSGLFIRVAFDSQTREWYLRELEIPNSPGIPSGKYARILKNYVPKSNSFDYYNGDFRAPEPPPIDSPDSEAEA